MTKYFWGGPGYYAGYQYDTAFDGSGMYAYYKVGDTAEEAQKEARERRLGTPTYRESPPAGAAII